MYEYDLDIEESPSTADNQKPKGKVVIPYSEIEKIENTGKPH